MKEILIKSLGWVLLVNLLQLLVWALEWAACKGQGDILIMYLAAWVLVVFCAVCISIAMLSYILISR